MPPPPPAPDPIRDYHAFLVGQVAELERLASTAATAVPPEVSAAVSARAEAAKLRRKIAQIEIYLARLAPTPRHRKGERKQVRALALIAAGRSSAEVATELGVNRATVNRWRADPAFAEQLRELQDDQMDAVHAQLVASALGMVRCLIDVATGVDTTDQSRVQAVRVAMELLGRSKESPVAPAAKEGEAESEEDVLDLLGEIPESLLERSLAERRAPKVRDL